MEQKRKKLIKVLVTVNKQDEQFNCIIKNLEERLIDFGSNYVIAYLTKEEIKRLIDNDFVVLYEMNEEG